MGTMDVYSFTTEEFEASLTQVKNLFVSYLVENGYLSEEQADNLILNTAILARKPSFFSITWKKILKENDADHPHFIVVEQKSMHPKLKK